MMTTASTSTYGDAVRKALDDLPARQYLELVDGLDEHLAEVASDYDALVEQLGEPESYAAELRASARFAARAAEAPASTPAGHEPARPLIETKTLARGALIAIGFLFAVLVLNGELVVPEVVFVAATAFALAWVVRRLVAASHLPPTMSRRTTIALPIGAIVFAALLGASFSNRSTIQYVDSGPANQFAGPDVTVPNIVGLSVSDATTSLHSLGFEVQFSGVDQSRTMVVTAQSPPPGTVTMAGTVVLATLDRRSALPTPPTTALPTPPTTAEPAPSSSTPS
ncbi:MAG: PASTA domain-containing protein [Acidimicrobiia bacterium]